LGGAALIIDPSGQSIGLKVEELTATMFSDYQVPGVILFLAIGVLGTSAAILTAVNHKYYSALIFYQGLILTGWILVQVYLLPTTHFLQAVFGLLGIILLMTGSYLLVKKEHLKALY
jgi:membrane-bound ClpP family serine protease